MEKRWTIKPINDLDTCKFLSRELNISNILSRLLVQRGVKTFEDSRIFFRPQLVDLHDPFLMMDMDKAVERIDQAIKKNERILIYGDYDVDGTTSVALFYSFLNSFYPNCDFYIPDRYSEGYGLSYKSIDFAIEQGITLFITFDCGIKAIEQVNYATERGIDVIITDHHIQGEILPSAYAVVDPKRTDCTYPDKNLSGCGIAYKLAHAYSIKNNIEEGVLNKYLDLVAVSIAADIVPLIGENRILAYLGLKMLNEKPRLGLRAVLEQSNFTKILDITDIVFMIAPRINAAGRINTGKTAVELLICTDETKAFDLAKSINEDNATRKDLDTQITEEAIKQLVNNPDIMNGNSTVVFDTYWHKGVVGIVASRLIDVHYRPTIVLTESDGLACGSARSIKGFDLYSALEQCSDLLTHFGGHMYAAGLGMKLENLEPFKRKFEEIAASQITPEMLTPEIEIDAEIELKEITQKFFRILKQFGPFGPDNMKPIFKSTGIIDRGNARVVGKNHLRLNIMSESDPSLIFDAIAFKQSDVYERINRKEPFDICYTIEENEWNGNVSLQLNIKDIKFNN